VLAVAAVVGVIYLNQNPLPTGGGGGSGAGNGGGNGGGGGAAPQAPITVTGSGIENSAPFHLNGGDYRVAWTATPHSDGGCYHGLHLEPTGGSGGEWLAAEMIDTAAPMNDSTYVYGVSAGSYYINANSGCDWTVTLSQQ
jgi:hypothetical protein